MSPARQLSGVLLLLLITAPALAQERDRASPDPSRERSPLAQENGVAAVESADPVEALPAGPKTVDADLDVSGFPNKDNEPEYEEERKEDTLIFKHSGKAAASLGHDTNVFRAQRNRTRDGFFRAGGDVELTAKAPSSGSELFVEFSGETLVYFERTPANEHFVSAFAEYFQPVTDWLDLGAQNALEFSRLNLLNDNGDLFPRGRFGSIDEEVRLFAIVSPFERDLAIEVGGSYRWKNYDENSALFDSGGAFISTVDSLDYQEVRADVSVGYKISRRPRSRIKLKYRFRRRDYEEFRARDRDGITRLPSPTSGEASPHLNLHRHQVNLRWSQGLELGWFQGGFVLNLGATYNRDLHQNDRSYRELSAALSFEWWVQPKTTRIDFSVRGVARNFIVRHKQELRYIGTSLQFDNTGTPEQVRVNGHLRHRLLRIKAGVWQRLWVLESRPDDGEAPRDLITVAGFVAASGTVWRSGDPLEDYDRFVVEGGVEVSW